MTEQHEPGTENPDAPSDRDAEQDTSEQDGASTAGVEDRAADLRQRGAVARPRDENPAEAAPKDAPTQ